MRQYNVAVPKCGDLRPLFPPSPEKCSSLMAVACDDFSVYVVDTDTRRTVRVFTGHSNRITDMV